MFNFLMTINNYEIEVRVKDYIFGYQPVFCSNRTANLYHDPGDADDYDYDVYFVNSKRRCRKLPEHIIEKYYDEINKEVEAKGREYFKELT